MPNTIDDNLETESSNLKFPGEALQHFFAAITAGLIGFFSFSSALVLSNLLYHKTFIFDLGDILLSLLGFLCMSILSIMERTKK